MIPRIVHQVWLGSAELPPVLGALVDGVQFQAYLAGWEHSLWDAEELWRAFGDEWILLADKCRDLATMVDVARLLVLRKHGGLYLDADVEVFALPGELHGSWIAGTDEDPGRLAVNNCVLASEVDGAYVSRMLDRIQAGGVDLGKHCEAGPRLCSAEFSLDVYPWPRRVWHGRRGELGVMGHHYGWGYQLDSFVRAGKLPS